MKCPKCDTVNSEDSQFCKKCATSLTGVEEAQPLPTQTIETPREELTTGSTFAGRYQIIEELGKGGMGRVYKALDTKINEKIALKLIKPEIASDKKTIARFTDELRLARKISHPNVGRMYELMEVDGTHFISMEYIPGQDLKGLIRQSTQLGIGTAINIARQICQGLSEAHRLGIIHRDLKPHNILIDREGTAKIMDFGIARSIRARSRTGPGVVIGTPEYMSPEQVEAKDVDQRSDIYALGIILYEMLTGRVPFEGDTHFAVGIKHKSEVPENPKQFNSRIPEELSRIILKSLAKDPKDRFQTTEEVCSDLSLIEQGLPTTDRSISKSRASTSRQITVSFTPKRLIIPTVVLAALLLVVILVWNPWGGKSPFIPSDSGLPSIGFLKLRNGTGDSNLDHLCATIPELLIADLGQSRYLRVQSAARINQVLRQLNLTDETSFAADELREIARKSGVKSLVTGNFSKFGENFRVNISVIDAETSDILSTEKSEVESEENLFALVDDLTHKIKSNFNLTPSQLASDQDKEVGVITTPYPEAYRYYNEGRNLYLRQDYFASIPLMERAIQIDPDFAMAYRSIAMAYSNMGGNSDKVKEYLDKALEKSARLSYKEKKIIEAQHSGTVEKDFDKELAIWEELLEDYPEDNFVNQAIAVFYDDRLDYDNAIRHYEVCRKNRNEFMGTYTSLGLVYMSKGEYQKSREVLRDCIEYFYDSARMRQWISGTYLCEGRIDEAIAEAQKAIAMNPRMFSMGWIDHIRGDFEAAEKDYEKLLDDDSAYMRMTFSRFLAILNMTQGKHEKALSFIQNGLALAKEESDLYFTIVFLELMGYRDLAIGKFEDALTEAQTMWERAVEYEVLAYQLHSLILQSLVYHQIQQPEKIRAAANLVERQLEAFGLANTPYTREILIFMGLADLTEGKHESATEILMRAWALRDRETLSPDLNDHILFLYYLGEAQLLAGDFDAARKTYEEGLDLTLGKWLYGILWAKSHFKLGEVYEKLGNQDKAIEHTEKFLEMWKDADPGLPELTDARTRLIRLQNQ
ncbi:protein kinase [Acidobacteriota bacterium]